MCSACRCHLGKAPRDLVSSPATLLQHCRRAFESSCRSLDIFGRCMRVGAAEGACLPTHSYSLQHTIYWLTVTHGRHRGMRTGVERIRCERVSAGARTCVGRTATNCRFLSTHDECFTMVKFELVCTHITPHTQGESAAIIIQEPHPRAKWQFERSAFNTLPYKSKSQSIVDHRHLLRRAIECSLLTQFGQRLNGCSIYPLRG